MPRLDVIDIPGALHGNSPEGRGMLGVVVIDDARTVEALEYLRRRRCTLLAVTARESIAGARESGEILIRFRTEGCAHEWAQRIGGVECTRCHSSRPGTP